MSLLYLSPFQAALVPSLLAVGVYMLIKPYFDRKNSLHRSIVLGFSAFLAVRYGYWRGTETLATSDQPVDFIVSVAFYVIEMAALLGSLSTFALMSRYRERSNQADAGLGWWQPRQPRVAICIATYNEELQVLERTIIGARALKYKNKEVICLDDGKRPWLKAYCERLGVRYIARADNRDAKAGNINNALAILNADPIPPDFIAILDADFVPHKGFITRCLALFRDRSIGIVQTPQHFFNADPIQHNLGLTHSYPDEQRFFFDHMQCSRDAWGITICCGTSSMIRRSALNEIGGVPTDSVTEDFLISLKMQSHGYVTAYLNEPLSEGLAPEGLKEYISQRARWCLGLMQIVRSPMGPFKRNGLRLRDRWSVLDAVVYWLPGYIFRVSAICFPLLYWYFNIIVVNASVTDIITYFGLYFVVVQLAMRLCAPGMIVPIFHDMSQLVGAFPILRAGVIGLLKPKGHPFSVTAKGGDRSKVVVQWDLMRPFTVLLSLTLFGLLVGILSDDFAYNDAGEGKQVVLFWTIYNLIILSVTILACVEVPRREYHIADGPDKATFVNENGSAQQVWLASMTEDLVRVRGQELRVGEVGTLRIEGIGDVAVEVIEETTDGGRLLLQATEDQREALLLRFYTDGLAPGTVRSGTVGLVRDILIRLSNLGS